MNSFEKLPDLVTKRVFDFLDLKSGIEASKTCVYLYSQFQTANSWKSVDLSTFSKTLNQFQLYKLLDQIGPGVKELNISDNPNISSRIFEIIAEKCQKLKRLQAVNCKNIFLNIPSNEQVNRGNILKLNTIGRVGHDLYMRLDNSRSVVSTKKQNP
ncbi:putative F-box/LRR-repeat protein [Smittium mucronatum]|uniref:Putative F-box/LRR-repeat protein n=1 Tax=Smittium mucronatum TaxID=133383 RepID=A0A1R0GZH2_9FUNG|nr:putative F-box/LRR-repeat protein [Smittium mucronatum]